MDYLGHLDLLVCLVNLAQLGFQVQLAQQVHLVSAVHGY